MSTTTRKRKQEAVGEPEELQALPSDESEEEEEYVDSEPEGSEVSGDGNEPEAAPPTRTKRRKLEEPVESGDEVEEPEVEEPEIEEEPEAEEEPEESELEEHDDEEDEENGAALEHEEDEDESETGEAAPPNTEKNGNAPVDAVKDSEQAQDGGEEDEE